MPRRCACSRTPAGSSLLAVQDPAVAGELETPTIFWPCGTRPGEDRPALAACQIGVRHSETAMRRHPLDPDCAGRWLRALGLLSRLQIAPVCGRCGRDASAVLKAGILRLTQITPEQHRSRLAGGLATRQTVSRYASDW